MPRIVTRNQIALNIWNMCSEHTGSLPPAANVGGNPVPDDSIIVHFLTTADDVEVAAADLRVHPLATACCVGRSEDFHIQPAVNTQIDGLFREFAGTGRLFGDVEDLAKWVELQIAGEPATM